MVNFLICKGIRSLANNFRDLFSNELAKYTPLCALYTYFLFNMKSLSQLARECPWSPSVSQLSRAVNSFEGNRAMKRLRRSVLRKLKKRINSKQFCFAIDDTSNPKYGKNTFRGGYWRGNDGIMYGQKIIVIALVDIKNKKAYPLSYRFAIKKSDPNYRKMPSLAIDLVNEVLNDGFPELPITVDSWFDGADFINELDSQGLTVVGQLKSNRGVKVGISPTSKWHNVKNFFRAIPRKKLKALYPFTLKKNRSKWYSEKRIFIRKVKKQITSIAVYNRKNGKDSFGFYYSNNTSLTGAQLWRYSRARWSIECLFRDLKQNLSFGKLPCHGESGANLAVCFPFILYVSLNLDHNKVWMLKNHESTGFLVRKIMQKEWRRSIESIRENPNSALVNKYRSRNHQARLTKKPIDSVVEEIIPLKIAI